MYYTFHLLLDSISFVERELHIGTQVMVDWKNFMRDVCAQYYKLHSRKISHINHMAIHFAAAC
jgi:hypothetical protein